MNFIKNTKEYIHTRPNIKRIIGVILVLFGIFAFFTPLTPGSWLFFIGLELLGLRILFFKKKILEK